MTKTKNMAIKERLTRGFIFVALISSMAAVVGCVAMLFITNRYNHALTYYAFPQGDIGQAMTAYSETRSALRAAIGYSDADAIAQQVQKYNEQKTAFEEHLAEVEKTMVTPEGHAAFDNIINDLKGYWELGEEILELGATTDMEQAAKAQDRALKELTPQYDVGGH